MFSLRALVLVLFTAAILYNPALSAQQRANAVLNTENGIVRSFQKRESNRASPNLATTISGLNFRSPPADYLLVFRVLVVLRRSYMR